MDRNPKQSKARELLWLAVAFMSLFAAVHKTIYVSFYESWYFYIFTLISLLLYIIRRNLRKKEE
jgi:hypothetical protein